MPCTPLKNRYRITLKSANNKNRSNSPNSVAFTLVEVLVALAIFGMAVVVLGSAYVNVLTSYESIRRDQVREQEMEFVFFRILSVQVREQFEQGGTVETLHSGTFDWEARLEQTAVADLFRAEITVGIPPIASGGGRREVTETFILFRPGWEEASERDRLRQESRERLVESREAYERG